MCLAPDTWLLPQEVGRLIKEKQELHTQYAHEIEAAHAQLNEREHELEVEHRKIVQELKEHHQQGGLLGGMVGYWEGWWVTGRDGG